MRRVPRQCPNCRGGDVSAVQSLYERFRHLGHEVAKFGSVGAAAFVIDVGVFNVLTATSSPLHHKVLTAKAVSTTLAATFAYFANRQWTWKDRIRSGLGREYGLFFLFNAIGLGIAETCLAISEYGLHEHSVLARNISANGFGLVLGTLFRFWAYRRWVFVDAEEPLRTEEAASAAIV
jgi:putative flippase GtrA